MAKSTNKRTHDAFYADEVGTVEVKDSFKFVSHLISRFSETSKVSELSILDVGCAAGSFPAFLAGLRPADKVSGLELLPDLVELAKSRNPDLTIIEGSVLDSSLFGASSFDVVTMMGVIGIFEEITDVFTNLKHWLNPDGVILVHGMFNPWDLDVFVSYRDVSMHDENHREVGWNIFSQKKVSETLLGLGATDVVFHEFKISSEIAPRPNDPVRSWTERAADGSLRIVNGLCLNQPHFVCEARF